MTMPCRSGLARPPTQCSGALAPVSPLTPARATMPSRKSSGKVASEPSSTPSARSPFHVNAIVTQRWSDWPAPAILAPVPTLSMRPDSHARPWAGSRNVTNPYRAARAGGRVSRKCWMSSSSSVTLSTDRSLHLIEHGGERRLQLQSFLDLVGAHVGILTVLQEARTLVFPEELDDAVRVGLPVLRPALEVHEYGGDSGLEEDRERVLEILVEIGIEDPLIHEVQARADVEQDPTEIVELERSENGRIALDRLLDRLRVVADGLLAAWFDLGDDRKAVIGRCPGKDRPIATLLELEISLFGDRHRRRFRPILFG